jgi:hypothetical protein
MFDNDSSTLMVFSSTFAARATSVSVIRPTNRFPSVIGSFFTLFSNISRVASASCMFGSPTTTCLVIISENFVSLGFLHFIRTLSRRSLLVRMPTIWSLSIATKQPILFLFMINAASCAEMLFPTSIVMMFLTINSFVFNVGPV